jgi:phage repressor protein C with HTH and peptisase S24 domain
MVSKKEKSLLDIVKEQMDAKKINIRQLALQTGIPADRIYKWFQRNLNPKVEDADTLREWLGSNSDVVNVPRETLGPSYLEQRRWGKIIGEEYFVPFVPFKARAGYSKNYENVEFIDNLETFQIPPGIPWRGSEWRWFEVGGNSMEPVLYDKDLILCSLIGEADWSDMTEFLIYVIVWKDDVSVKRVAKKNSEEWVLISENEEEYPQKKIRVSDVKEVWKVRRQLNAKLPPTKRFKITV